MKGAVAVVVAPRHLNDYLLAHGRPFVTLADVAALTGLTKAAATVALVRLRQAKQFFSPHPGLYAAVPTQYRTWGVVPGTDFIDVMMTTMGRRYYAALLSAAELHGLSVPACTVAVMSSQFSPHDAVFRRVLGEPANAASQLRAVLPAALVDRLELDRLTRVSGSFVDAALRWRHSDLLFTVPMQGREVLVYVLVEHQSSEDPLMAFRPID